MRRLSQVVAALAALALTSVSAHQAGPSSKKASHVVELLRRHDDNPTIPAVTSQAQEDEPSFTLTLNQTATMYVTMMATETQTEVQIVTETVTETMKQQLNATQPTVTVAATFEKTVTVAATFEKTITISASNDCLPPPATTSSTAAAAATTTPLSFALGSSNGPPPPSGPPSTSASTSASSTVAAATSPAITSNAAATSTASASSSAQALADNLPTPAAAQGAGGDDPFDISTVSLQQTVTVGLGKRSGGDARVAGARTRARGMPSVERRWIG